MNFTFMILLLLVIFIYITLKFNVKKIYSLIFLTLLLILNEFYLKGDISSNEHFYNPSSSSSQQNTITSSSNQLSRTLNAQEQFNRYFKYKDIDGLLYNNNNILNNSFTHNNNIKRSLECHKYKYLSKHIDQQNKLSLQNSYINKLIHYIFPNYNNTKPVNFDDIDLDKNLNIFNGLKINNELKELECPTLCLAENDKEKCNEKLFVDNMVDEDGNIDEDTYKKFTDTIKECESIDKEEECNINTKCKWNKNYGTCLYDVKGCTYIDTDKSNVPKCHKRCEHLKTEDICINHSFYDMDSDIKQMCEWDREQCKTKSDLCNSIYKDIKYCDKDKQCKDKCS